MRNKSPNQDPIEASVESMLYKIHLITSSLSLLRVFPTSIKKYHALKVTRWQPKKLAITNATFAERLLRMLLEDVINVITTFAPNALRITLTTIR